MQRPGIADAAADTGGRQGLAEARASTGAVARMDVPTGPLPATWMKPGQGDSRKQAPDHHSGTGTGDSGILAAVARPRRRNRVTPLTRR